MSDFWLLDLFALIGAGCFVVTSGIVVWVLVQVVADQRQARAQAELDARVECFPAEFEAWRASEVDQVWSGKRAA